MGLDGGFLHCLIKELNIAIGCKVDKVYQPSKDELVFALRSKEFNGRLFVSANPSSARLHFTKKSIENPAQPPMLCMLLRKHLVGARLINITQQGLDRIAILEFEGINEMGDTTRPKLIVELIGRSANIIFTDRDGKIIDTVRRSDIEKGGRLIQPGATYTPPEAQAKENPLLCNIESVAEAAERAEGDRDKIYLSLLEGVSPAVCRELALESSPKKALEFLRQNLLEGGEPYTLRNAEGAVIDFSYIPLKQYGNSGQAQLHESFSAMLDEIYSERDAKSRITHSAQQLNRLVSSLKGRILRKLDARRAELLKCEGKEDFRIKGELLKANLHLIEAGAKSVRVQNYYDPELSEINIKLKEELSGSANAALLFKEYKKLCNAQKLLDELIFAGEQELAYIESVADALERAESTADLNDIKTELETAGYLRRPSKAPALQKSKPLEYLSPNGFKILVGRNNIQNDQLTFKVASKNDTWLHVKDFPGAHCIIISNGAEIPDETLLFAAKLTAYHTAKTRLSSAVPVDYTLVKRVKKQPGGKPGMVTYTDQHTLYVTPDQKM